MADQSTRRRVKLYALNAERQWDDRGTGHVTSSYVEKLQGVSLLVKAESDGNILLESKIQPETVYQKQQETLIVWSEGDNFDLALSFQERAGCDEIWEKICQVQGRDPSVEITQEVVEESEDERFDDMSDTVPSIELPAAEMGRLEEISELINSCLHSAIKREKLTLAVEADNYIPKLMRMFQMCEDVENTAGLHHLHDIIINLFQLNKNALIESMFKIDVIFDVVGCLEYDPANPVPTRHREYLKQMANFKQVLPIRNSELLAKIHQTYRVQYIQDIVLPTPNMFEDNVLSTLSSFIFFNKLDIVRQLQDDEKFLTEFFSLLSDEKTPITKRRDLVLFLKEFCTFSHTLQPQSKDTFFKTLLSLGVLQALETTLTVDAGDLSQPGQVIKAACIDILMYIVETVPPMVREHMVQQAESCDDDQLLMNLIVEQMVCDRDPEVGSAVQLSGIIRILIDPENMVALNRSEKTEFLAFFYKHCMHSLVAPLLANTTDEWPLHDDPATVQLLNLVLELLSFCVEHHTFHAKNFIITRNMVARILVLMKSKHKYLVLDALRFLRKMVALKDENYNRHIVKQNLFAPVVEAFFHNQGRYNLLDSAVIELFEFIKTEDIKTLLAYIVETFGDKLLDVTYVQTFRNLKQRYEQQQDRLQQRTTALESVPSIQRCATRFRRDPRQMDEDEEMWFNDDDDYEEAVEPTPGAGLGAAAAVSDLEQIGKLIEGRSKLFTPSAAAELTADKESVELDGTATAPAAKTPPGAAAQSVAISMVKKVGLVDYDADSDEEEEDGCEDSQLSPLSLQLPPSAAGQLASPPSLQQQQQLTSTNHVQLQPTSPTQQQPVSPVQQLCSPIQQLCLPIQQPILPSQSCSPAQQLCSPSQQPASPPAQQDPASPAAQEPKPAAEPQPCPAAQQPTAALQQEPVASSEQQPAAAAAPQPAAQPGREQCCLPTSHPAAPTRQPTDAPAAPEPCSVAQRMTPAAEQQAAPAQRQASPAPGPASPPQQAASSAQQQTFMPQEQASSPQQQTSLAQQQTVPAQQQTSPCQEQIVSLQQQVSSPPQQASPAQQEASPAQQEASLSQQEVSPARQEASPAQQEAVLTQQKVSSAEQEASPAEQGASPAEQGASPAEQGASPAQQEASPAQQQSSPPMSSSGAPDSPCGGEPSPTVFCPGAADPLSDDDDLPCAKRARVDAS